MAEIAVSEGAAQGKRFAQDIEYLDTRGYLPPRGKAWADVIRRKANDATHGIVLKSRQDAEQLLSFTEMLLKFICEFPGRLPQSTP